MNRQFRCVIMGAAGRDFHDFLTFFRDNDRFHVCAFTATQIPFIETRSFPRALAGDLYEDDIPIHPESDLPDLIRRHEIEFVFLSYSDLSYREVMHKASLVQACGAAFCFLGPRQTQLVSRRPVISVTAVRTGAGKSPLTQSLAYALSNAGHRVGIVRHPMPYGDLCQQQVQTFRSEEDFERHACTVEEREEYEPYVEMGLTIYAGTDYHAILREVEQESDVILWDGGNNDYSFFRPDLSIVVADALRPGHETGFYPGETNLRLADVVVINKVAQARADDVWSIRQRVDRVNPRSQVIESDLEITVDSPHEIEGRTVIVVEDGPTLTHGGMPYGAGLLAAKSLGVKQVVDPRPFAVGTIREAFRDFPHIHDVVPALGYSTRQCEELAETINASGADIVIDASPARLDRLLDLNLPSVRVRYRFRQTAGKPILETVNQFLSQWRPD